MNEKRGKSKKKNLKLIYSEILKFISFICKKNWGIYMINL